MTQNKFNPNTLLCEGEDLLQMQEAARQLSVMSGVAPSTCMRLLLNQGIREGKLPEGTVKPQAGDGRPCLTCGSPVYHPKPFCSAACFKSYEQIKKCKDKDQRVIRVSNRVQIQPDEGDPYMGVVREIFYDQPTVFDEGYWVDVECNGLVAGQISYQMTLLDQFDTEELRSIKMMFDDLNRCILSEYEESEFEVGQEGDLNYVVKAMQMFTEQHQLPDRRYANELILYMQFLVESETFTPSEDVLMERTEAFIQQACLYVPTAD